MLKNREQLTITNVDVLHQYSPINFFSRETESKQRIKNNLLSLKQKEIISFPVDEVKNNTLLTITFVDDLKDESIGKGVKGFEKIEYNKFISFPSMIDNYIYFTVKRFDSLGGFKCDYERWSYILDVAKKTAQTKVDEAVKHKIIYKNIGDYKEEELNNRKQKKQEINTYKSIPFVEEEKSIQTKKVEIKEQQQKLIDNEVKNPGHDDEIEIETREHQWNVRNSELTAIDLFIYLTTNDEKLKKKAEGRIKAISNNSKGEYMIGKLMDEAKEMVKDVEKKQLQEKLKSATNAIRLQDDSIVVVDASNIDNYKFEDIKTFFYSNDTYSNGECIQGELSREFNIKSFQPSELINGNKTKYHDRPDMIQLGLKYYAEYVKSNITVNYENGREIQEQVFKDNGFIDEFENQNVKTRVVKVKSPSSPKEEVKKERKQVEPIDIASIGVSDLDIDLMNEIMERDNVVKKDEMDISFLLDDEEEVKPEPKQKNKSMKEWVDEMYETKKNPFNNDDKDLSCLDELE
ncbi:hypothetical protein [Schinkia azotoformans]|nr:hypothetical protein [Schinkia azotoformans]MEC1744561.1 hypothetical protein [Schinkia azotoformans]